MSYESDARDQRRSEAALKVGFVMACLIVFVLVVGGGMWGCPKYGVYKNELRGKAALAEAQYDRKIAIEEAEAEKESAQHLADAELIRAKGLSQAIAEVGRELESNPSYLRYRWIEGLHDGSSELIYVATEAGLPILEANRLAKPATIVVEGGD